LPKDAISRRKDSGKEKKSKPLYKGWFNFQRELRILHCHAYSERQAWMNMCRQIAKLHDVSISMVMNYFNGDKDNYAIKEEEFNGR
jgi:hypothetical protein